MTFEINTHSLLIVILIFTFLLPYLHLIFIFSIFFISDSFNKLPKKDS